MIHDTIGQHEERTPTAEALLASDGLISVQVLNELAADGPLHADEPRLQANGLCTVTLPMT